jgi:hypothetical protein
VNNSPYVSSKCTTSLYHAQDMSTIERGQERERVRGRESFSHRIERTEDPMRGLRRCWGDDTREDSS